MNGDSEYKPQAVDVEAGRNVLVGALKSAGMHNLHRTDTDWQFGNDRSFKISVGTAYKEVSIHFERNGKTNYAESVRVTQAKQMVGALDRIDEEIDAYHERNQNGDVIRYVQEVD